MSSGGACAKVASECSAATPKTCPAAEDAAALVVRLLLEVGSHAALTALAQGELVVNGQVGNVTAETPEEKNNVMPVDYYTQQSVGCENTAFELAEAINAACWHKVHSAPKVKMYPSVGVTGFCGNGGDSQRFLPGEHVPNPLCRNRPDGGMADPSERHPPRRICQQRRNHPLLQAPRGRHRFLPRGSLAGQMAREGAEGRLRGRRGDAQTPKAPGLGPEGRRLRPDGEKAVPAVDLTRGASMAAPPSWQ